MSVDPELLEILACPESQGALELVELPAEVREQLVEKYREFFQGEAPEVSQGLFCEESKRVYPIVADIPIMLVDEALPATAIGR